MYACRVGALDNTRGARSSPPDTGGDAPGRVSAESTGRGDLAGLVLGLVGLDIGALRRPSLLASRWFGCGEPREEGGTVSYTEPFIGEPLGVLDGVSPMDRWGMTAAGRAFLSDDTPGLLFR